MTNEINKLIWPSTNGIGIIDEAAWDQTVDIALNTKNETGATIITDGAAGDGVHQRVRRAGARRARGRGVDVDGADFAPIEVTLNEGGN